MSYKKMSDHVTNDRHLTVMIVAIFLCKMTVIFRKIIIDQAWKKYMKIQFN